MSHLSPFRVSAPNLNPELTTSSNPKKRRKNAPNPIQTTPMQDLLPPPLTGYGDTIVASNPFDDCPSTVNNIVRTQAPPPPLQQSQHMNMCRPMVGGMNMGSPMMHSPNGMQNTHGHSHGHMMIMNGPPPPRPPPPPPSHMSSMMNMNGPMGSPMHVNPMNSPIGPHGMNAGPPQMVNQMGPGVGVMNVNGMNGPPPPQQMNVNHQMNGPLGHPMGMNAGSGGPIGPHGPPMNNNFMMAPMGALYPKPLPMSAGKVYPPDQSKVYNSQNPNAPPIYPCGVCHKEVHDNDQAIMCESGCNFWYHRGCTGLSEAAYQMLTAEVYAEWACDKCMGSKHIPVVKFKP